MNEPISLTLIIAFLVGVVATGRLTRFAVDDDMPILVWLREKYILAVPEKWAELVMCGFCVSVWFALPNVLLAWATDLSWVWWLPNLWLAGAYLAAILHARDIPEG